MRWALSGRGILFARCGKSSRCASRQGKVSQEEMQIDIFCYLSLLTAVRQVAFVFL